MAKLHPTRIHRLTSLFQGADPVEERRFHYAISSRVRSVEESGRKTRRSEGESRNISITYPRGISYHPFRRQSWLPSSVTNEFLNVADVNSDANKLSVAISIEDELLNFHRTQ